MTSEQRIQVILCTIGAAGLTYLTIFICRDGFTKWALLTGFAALGCLGGIIEVFETKTSSGGGGAAGLAALFNNMDAKGAENFAQLLNTMGGASSTPASSSTPAPASTKSDDGSSSTGSLLAAMAPALVAGTTASVALAPGQFRVVVVDSLFSASMSVEMQSSLGAGDANVLHLAVMCFEENGRDVLQGEDKNKNWTKLDDVRQPAILYVPRETLPYLQQQPQLWRRVQQEGQA